MWENVMERLSGGNMEFRVTVKCEVKYLFADEFLHVSPLP